VVIGEIVAKARRRSSMEVCAGREPRNICLDGLGSVGVLAGDFDDSSKGCSLSGSESAVLLEGCSFGVAGDE
jgi:hypothetical protein